MSDLDWATKQVHKVWLKTHGFIKVAEIDRESTGIAYIATDDLTLVKAETIEHHSDCR